MEDPGGVRRARRRCCEFFSFELEEQGDELLLRVWGRDGVRGYLRGDLAVP
jgi:hypothetical protein